MDGQGALCRGPIKAPAFHGSIGSVAEVVPLAKRPGRL